MASADGKGGEVQVAESAPGTVRLGRLSELVVAEGRARYAELARKGRVFSLVLTANSSSVSAGNVVGAAAAAITQFAVFNPVSSQINLELIRYGMGTVSGTPAAGPMWHGTIATPPTIASIGGTIQRNLPSGPASVCTPFVLAAGSALTGASAPVQLMMGNFVQTATAAATAATIPTVDLLDGAIIIPPGYGYVPLLAGAGTTWLVGHSLTWAEVPV